METIMIYKNYSCQCNQVWLPVNRISLCNGLLWSKDFVFCLVLIIRIIDTLIICYYSIICFHSKQVAKCCNVYISVSFKKCHTTGASFLSNEVLYSACKHLVSDLEHQNKQSFLASPRRWIKYQTTNFNYPTKICHHSVPKDKKKNMQTKGLKIRQCCLSIPSWT